MSAGDGLDPDFYESDLSDGSGCGAHPPTAEDLLVVTGKNTSIAFDLDANDDGKPAPPSLTYRITSLPANGSLTDDAGGLFAIDANTGVVTVAGSLDRETAASYDIEVTATSTDGSTSAQTYTIAINDLGLRDGSVAPDDTIDVLAVGNSFTVGFGLPAEEAWPARLETLLNGAGESGSLVAAGVGCGCRHADPPLEETQAPEPGGTAVLGTISDVDSWNEYTSRQDFAGKLHRRIFLRLARERPNGEGEPLSYELLPLRVLAYPAGKVSGDTWVGVAGL